MGVRMGITARGSSSGAIGRRRMLELNEDGTAGDLAGLCEVGVAVIGVPTSPMASRPYMRLRKRARLAYFSYFSLHMMGSRASCREKRMGIEKR